jgi:hypothetical protein
VVAEEKKDRNRSLRQTPHLSHEKKPGLVIAPISVVEVAHNDEEVYFFLDCVFDEICEGSACRSANPFRRSAILTSQPFQRTIKMDVACMNKTERHKIKILQNKMAVFSHGAYHPIHSGARYSNYKCAVFLKH